VRHQQQSRDACSCYRQLFHSIYNTQRARGALFRDSLPCGAVFRLYSIVLSDCYVSIVIALYEACRQRKFIFLAAALPWDVMQSPPSVRLSVRLFLLYIRNRLTVDLEFMQFG